MTSPLRKPDGISWQAATVELPEIPLIPPGADAISATIAEVLPTLAAPLSANVAALSAKEDIFSGKVGAAQAAYQSADESGGQSVGQLTSMLGQVGQLGQAAGGPTQAAGQLGGQSGMFGSLMQQAMQGAPGRGEHGSDGAHGGRPASAAPQGGATGPTGGQPQQGHNAGTRFETRTEAGTEAGREHDREPVAEQQQDRELPQPGERLEYAEAGPDDSRHLAGSPPVTPPERPAGGDEDLARRM